MIVLAGVPMDSSYTNTRSFGSLAEQTAYFLSKTKYATDTATPCKTPWVFRVPWEADLLYDCNYVMYQNTTYGTKWFYGFITNIKFINPNCTELIIQLDVMQTWYFDYTLKSCFVEREHTLTDNIGEHLIAEPYGCGELVSETPSSPSFMSGQRAIILYAEDGGQGEGTIGGLFTGLSIMSAPLDSSGTGAVLDMLQTLEGEGKANNVVATYIMPDAFYTTGSSPVTRPFTVLKAQSTLGSYVPRNKKLLSYPYNRLSVYNGEGQTHDYRYEYFSGASCIFQLACAMGTSPEVVCIPVDYNSQSRAYDDMMTLSGWPQFSWVCDTYRTWLAINGNKLSTELLGKVVGDSTSYNILGGLSAGISKLSKGAGIPSGVTDDLSNRINETRNAIMQPNQGRGSAANNTMVAINAKNFYFEQVHTREDYAKVIDGIFDVYGYEVDTVKVPNVTGRPCWNYVKTGRCNAVGSVPFDDLTIINHIYNKGITFWHNDNVGDYSQNNSI